MDSRRERIANRYVLENRLGAGRGGQVYAAVDARTKARVALKLREIQPEVELDVERAGLRSIEHPNLVRVLDAGEDRGRPFVVAELVDGGALSALAMPLAAPVLTAVASQMLEALAFLHAQRILHGDVKTENVLIASIDPPQFKLADFGLAQRSVDVATAATRGSPAFMPPEIIRGEPADERSDLYSLGVTLYECAFGELPFGDEDVRAVLMRHLTEEPRRLRSPGAIDPRFSRLLRRLLAKEPAERPADARAALALWHGDEAAVPRWIPPRLGVLIGRDAELAELERALESDVAVVSIEGPPGVGKTRLLREFALRAELRGTPTFWWTPAGLAGPSTSAEAPSSRSLLPGGTEATAQGLAEYRTKLLRHRLGDDRFIVFLDDVGDRPAWFLNSASLLMRDCASHPRPGQLICVAGAEGVAVLVHDSLDAGGFTSLASFLLRPWPLESIQSAATALLGARRLQPDLLSLIAKASGGIPSEIESVCQLLTERGLLRLDAVGALATPIDVSVSELAAPVDVRAHRNIGRCTSRQLLALQVLALLRIPPSQPTLQSIAPLNADELAALQRLGLASMVPGSGGFQLPHERLRRTILADLDVNRVRELHDHVASVLEAQPDPAHKEEAVFHRAMGSDLKRARQAIRAMMEGHPVRTDSESLAVAIPHLLQLWPEECDSDDRSALEVKHVELLLRLGEYDRMHQSVDHLRSLAHFERYQDDLITISAEGYLESGHSSLALRALDQIPDGKQSSRASLLRARALAMQDQHSDALAICESLGSSSGIDLLIRAAVVELQATSMRALGRITKAASLLDSFLQSSEDQLQPRIVGSLLANLGLSHFYQGRMTEAETCFERSLLLLSKVGDRHGMARVLNSLAGTAGETGRYTESAERLRRALDLSRRLGETETTSYILANLGQLLMLQAEYSEALDRAREAVNLSRRRQLLAMYIQSRVLLGGILAALGMEKQCHEELAELLEEASGRPAEGHILLLWSGLALERGTLDPVKPWLARARSVFASVSAEDEIVVHDLLLSRWHHAQGDSTLALNAAETALNAADRLRLLGSSLELRIWLAELLLGEEVEKAERVATESLESCRRSGLRELLWRAERVLARIAQVKGDHERALIHYESALRVLQEIAANLTTDQRESYVTSPVRAGFFQELREFTNRLDPSR